MKNNKKFHNEKSCFFTNNSYFFHKEREKNINNGKISKRPASISNDKTIFDKSVKLEKFPVGPTTPRPGPTLLKHVATALNADVKSIFCKETNKNDKGSNILIVSHGMAIRRFLEVINCTREVKDGFLGNCGFVKMSFDGENFEVLDIVNPNKL